MSERESLQNSARLIHTSAAVPIYRWRGAQSWMFDLESDQQGWLTCLHLTREGDTSLIPLAWEYHDATADDSRTLVEANLLEAHLPGDHDPHHTPYPTTSWRTTAHDDEAVTLTLREMEQEGWQLNGRFDIYFSGTDTDAHFLQNIHQLLWQSPQS